MPSTPVGRVAAATATNTGLSSSLPDPIIGNTMLYNNMYWLRVE